MLVRYTLDPNNPVRLTEAEKKHMDEMPIDYSDIPELDDDFFRRAILARDLRKKQLTIRLDPDVLEWVKSHGKGYQTRINRILRMAMESQVPVPSAKPRATSQLKQRSMAASKRRSEPRAKQPARVAKRRSVS
jgi:uncharacterized protein (DUF4415 family)